MPRIEIHDSLLPLLETHCPKYLSLQAFCNHLIDQALTGELTYPRAMPVRETINFPISSSSSGSENSLTPMVVGDGVGRESEGGQRKGVKPVNEKLQFCEVLIRDFWKVKKGSKSDHAWSLLNTELVKILEAHDEATVISQINLAINGLWKGITMANMQRFETPSGRPAEPEFKHPASRVFTAADFT
jgi:hypothetical protein